jgi:hypothetical protein
LLSLRLFLLYFIVSTVPIHIRILFLYVSFVVQIRFTYVKAISVSFNTNDEEENSEAPLAPSSNKEIVEALSVLRKAVQHRVDEIGFEQHYSYTNMVMELLDTIKQILLDTYFK